jgi:hypothetical protein
VAERNDRQQPVREDVAADDLIGGVEPAPSGDLDPVAQVVGDQTVAYGVPENGREESVGLRDGGGGSPLAELGDPFLDVCVIDPSEGPGAPGLDDVGSHDRGVAGAGGDLVVAAVEPADGVRGEQ